MELKDTEREYADWADEEDLLLQQADAANAPFRTWLVPDVCDMDQCVKSWFLPQILQTQLLFKVITVCVIFFDLILRIFFLRDIFLRIGWDKISLTHLSIIYLSLIPLSIIT